MTTFRPLSTTNSDSSNYNQVNDMVRQLNKEQQVKVFKQSGDTNGIITGKYQEGRYGQVIYDTSGIPRVLIGQAPDDGRPGIWISRDGQNVLTLLGG